jgi:uncharacterized membrane protein YhhN
MSGLALSLAALTAAVLHVRAELRGPRWQVYLCKPLTTGLILALALSLPGESAAGYRTLIAAGLVCSLAGDVFLMLPSDRFLAGLASFLVAHGIYIAAFASTAGFASSLPALLPVAAVAGILLRVLWPRLGSARWPVVAYVGVITAMGWQALSQWLAAGEPWAACALVGAGLFLASDAVLAVDRFRGAFPAAPLAVLGTYYPAQYLIALSVARAWPPW